MTRNKSVERIAAGGRFSQLPTLWAAAIAHFCRYAPKLPMKALLVGLIACVAHITAFGQGTILFDTHVPGIVDSAWFRGMPASFYTNFGSGLGFVPPGEHTFQPLSPTTTLTDQGYVDPVVVTLPGVPPGTSAIIVDYIFDLKSNKTLGGYTTTITLGGGGLPPAYLTGLPYDMTYIPEPSVIALLMVGFCGAVLRFRSPRAFSPNTFQCRLKRITTGWRERRVSASVPIDSHRFGVPQPDRSAE